MSRNSSSSHTPGRSHRRLAAWLAFGAVGLATGAVWATGFATSTGTATTPMAPAAGITKDAPAADTPSSLAAVASAVTPLDFTFTGRWASVVDTTLFKVDLSAEAPGNTYNIALLLANTPALTGWATMKLKLEIVAPAGGVCLPGDFNGANDPKVMSFDNADAGVYWNVAGDAVYCLGINTSDGNDATGTLLRSAADVNPSVFPTFLTTVDRAS